MDTICFFFFSGVISIKILRLWFYKPVTFVNVNFNATSKQVKPWTLLVGSMYIKFQVFSICWYNSLCLSIVYGTLYLLVKIKLKKINKLKLCIYCFRNIACGIWTNFENDPYKNRNCPFLLCQRLFVLLKFFFCIFVFSDTHILMGDKYGMFFLFWFRVYSLFLCLNLNRITNTCLQLISIVLIVNAINNYWYV